MKSRRKFTAEFKSKVAIEAKKAQSIMAELCKKYRPLGWQCATTSVYTELYTVRYVYIPFVQSLFLSFIVPFSLNVIRFIIISKGFVSLLLLLTTWI